MDIFRKSGSICKESKLLYKLQSDDLFNHNSPVLIQDGKTSNLKLLNSLLNPEVVIVSSLKMRCNFARLC